MLQICELKQRCFCFLLLWSGVQLQNSNQIFSSEIEFFGQVDQKCVDGVREEDFILNEVVGGRDATPGRFPYLVSLQFAHPVDPDNKFGHWCGGTLISTDLILTAAHCVLSEGVDFRAQNGSTQGQINQGQLFAALNPQCRHMVGESRREVVEYFLREDYSGNAVKGNDIAVLKVSPAFDYEGPFINYGGSREVDFGDVGIYTAVGWGARNFTEIQLERYFESVVPLQMGFVQNQYADLCQQALQDQFLTSQIDPQTMICFQSQGTDTCFGDSGSPVLVADGQYGLNLEGNPAQDIQVAISSWGPDITCSGVSGLPGVYTNISNYVDWIDSIVFGDEGFVQKRNQVTSSVGQITKQSTSLYPASQNSDSFTTTTPTQENVILDAQPYNDTQYYFGDILAADSYVQYTPNITSNYLEYQDVYNVGDDLQDLAYTFSQDNQNNTYMQFEEVVLSVGFNPNVTLHNSEVEPLTEVESFDEIYNEDTSAGTQQSIENVANIIDVTNQDENYIDYVINTDSSTLPAENYVDDVIIVDNGTQQVYNVVSNDQKYISDVLNADNGAQYIQNIVYNESKYIDYVLNVDNSSQYPYNVAYNDSQLEDLLDLLVTSTQNNTQNFENKYDAVDKNQTHSTNFSSIAFNNSQITFSIEDNRYNFEDTESLQDAHYAQNDSQSSYILDILIASSQDDIEYLEELVREDQAMDANEINKMQYFENDQQNEDVDFDYLMKSKDIAISQILYFDSPTSDINDTIIIQPVIVNQTPKVNGPTHNISDIGIDQLKNLIEKGSTVESNVEINHIFYFDESSEDSPVSSQFNNAAYASSQTYLYQKDNVVLNDNISEISWLRNIIDIDPQTHNSNIQISRILYFESENGEEEYEEIAEKQVIQSDQNVNNVQNVDDNEVEWLRNVVEIDSNPILLSVKQQAPNGEKEFEEIAPVTLSQSSNQVFSSSMNVQNQTDNGFEIEWLKKVIGIGPADDSNIEITHVLYFEDTSEVEVYLDSATLDYNLTNTSHQIDGANSPVLHFKYPSNTNYSLDSYSDMYFNGESNDNYSNSTIGEIEDSQYQNKNFQQTGITVHINYPSNNTIINNYSGAQNQNGQIDDNTIQHENVQNNTQKTDVQLHFKYPSNFDNNIDTYSDFYTYDTLSNQNIQNGNYTFYGQNQSQNQNNQDSNVHNNHNQIQITQILYFYSPILSDQSQQQYGSKEIKLVEIESDLIENKLGQVDDLQPLDEQHAVGGGASVEERSNQADEKAWLQKIVSFPENSSVPLQKIVLPPSPVSP